MLSKCKGEIKMKYVVDAYNLIGAIRTISFTDPQKEEKLKQFILNRRAQREDEFFLVFDGKNKDHQFGSQGTTENGITLYFTAYGDTADGYMIEFMQNTKQKSGIIVVTSDREIQKAAKSARFAIQSVKDFLKTYDYRQEPEEEKPEEDDMGFWLDQFKA
jgi:predicted RNA-binding protein with PIN domain